MTEKAKMASSLLGPLAGVCALGILAVSTAAATPRSSTFTFNQQQSQPAAQSAEKPNLAGTWKLNKDQSDDPRQKMQEAMGTPSGQGGEGGQNGSGGRPPGGGGRPGRGQGRGGMMADWNQLSIEETGATVKVTGLGGTGTEGRLLATTEPQKESQANESGDNGGMRFPPATAEWQGNQLVAKSQGFGGGTTTRTFELSPDGKQLSVTTKIENERFNQPVTFKLVYDRGTPEGKNQ